jgi:hypothetical protein
VSRADGEIFMELLTLQGNNDVLTKDQLLASLNERGYQLSCRSLTTWITAGVLPKSARLGGRNMGVVPAITVDLACFVASCRRARLGFAEIHELLPLWRHLKQVILHPPHELDVSGFEKLARTCLV